MSVFQFPQYLTFALFNLIQLFLLIDAFTSLSISSQHCFSSRGAGSGQFVFEITRFLSCSTCSFFSIAEIVSNGEFQFGNFRELGFCFFEDSRELRSSAT